MKTMSMETEKSYDVLRYVQLHLSKYKKKWRFTIHYVKPTAQLLFNFKYGWEHVRKMDSLWLIEAKQPLCASIT